jgi:hypothetical protein
MRLGFVIILKNNPNNSSSQGASPLTVDQFLNSSLIQAGGREAGLSRLK